MPQELRADERLDDDAGDDDAVDVGEWPAATAGAEIHLAVHRFVRGVVQGCPFSTVAAVLPAHLALHEVHKQHPQLHSVSIADDSYFGARVGVLAGAFEAVRATHKACCNLDSNEDKIKAFVPGGGTAGIPDNVLQRQGGEVLGFKCGGSFVAANTPPRGCVAGRAAQGDL